ncbi:MAG: PAS domain S-box protein [Verrucomicrobiae bacterium]|nr:PAS domain S-box protein [Verrucomicrobiae bacterium]NNJ43938.1 PAS domain S-box protein [Akkermansiaceae bacterium]
MPENLDSLAPEDIRRLIHEMRVRQIELETENESLYLEQAELVASQERYIDLYERAPVGYVTVNDMGLIQQVNLRAATLLGVQRRVPIHRSISHILFHADERIFNLARKKLFKTREMQSCELRLVRDQGEPVWARLVLTLAHDGAGNEEIRIALSDITERKHTEEKLTEERNLLRTLVDILPSAVFVKDCESRFVLANVTCANLMGLDSPESLVGKTDADLYPPEIAAEFRAEELEVLSGKHQLHSEQRRILDNGDLQVRLISKVPIRSSSGEITGLVGSAFDITQRIQMEDELRANEAFERAILNSLPAHIAVLDQSGIIVAVNEPWLRFARENGNPGVEAIGVGVNYPDACKTLDSESESSAKDAVAGVLSVLSGKQPRFIMEYPCNGPRQPRWFVMEVIKLTGEGGGAIVAHTDITERKLNQRLLAWEKEAMESIVSESSLGQQLDVLILGMENLMPGVLCSVLILDDDGFHLRHGGAPSLPESYNRAIDGMVVGAGVGLWATAAQGDRQIEVADIASDPLWSDHREIALKHGLHTCWSAPIHSNQGEVLGTCAIYHSERYHPDAAEREVIERAVQVIRIAIENQRSEQKIHKLHAELEQRVEERTNELQSANATLNDFKSALDQHSVVATTDTEGTILYANDKFSEISKYSNEELIGQSHRIVNVGYHSEAFFRDLWETIISGRTWKGEIKNRCKDGSTYWVNGTIVPFLGPDNKPVQFMMISTDITKRKRMEVELQDVVERLRLAAEAGKIGVWEWNLATDEVTWDDQMFKIYGLPPSPQGRMDYSDWAAAVLPEDLAEQEEQLQYTVQSRGRGQREFRITRATDEDVRVIRGSEMIATDSNGKAKRMVGINYDATQSQRAEARIRELNAALEVRAEAQEAANKEMESFSYSVSHDLRAPLRAVSGFSRMVLEDYAGKMDGEGRRMLGVIHSEAQRMGLLIDDLLAFSRLGRHPIELKPIDMETMARDVFDELVDRHPERKLRLNLHTLPPAYGTGSLIRQVWTNLISNAIKFTGGREIGEIEIGAKSNGEKGQIYYIKDNGIGFDPRHADKLFGVFQRLHSQEEFSGTGVGLALVERIVLRHGSRIWAESEIDHGATFYFTLPHQPS